jgi:SAM-dependent methyltransferase
MLNDLLYSTANSLLTAIDQSCALKEPNLFEIFNPVEDDLWGLLLSKEYQIYPNIHQALPDLPDPSLQVRWVGNSGLALANQTLDFYTKVKHYQRLYGHQPLSNSRILDFGCGWGRILRYFAKDIPANLLFGCDPNPAVLDICQAHRVPGTLRQSECLPQTLPFDESFDLVYAFSIFTHLSEQTHLTCLNAIHQSLAPGGLLLATVRPKNFLSSKGATFASFDPRSMVDLLKSYDDGEYVFIGHQSLIVDGEDTYGDACIPRAYIEQHWTKLFKIVGFSVSIRDPAQFLVVCQKA